jgi:transposase
MTRKKLCKNVQENVQYAIIEGCRQGRTHKEVAAQFNVSRPTVTNLIRRWNLNGGYVFKHKPGRPRITDERTDHVIIRSSHSNPRFTAVDIAREISGTASKTPSARTIQRRLNGEGLFGRRPVKKPFISLKNRLARVAWARAHLHWVRKNWEQVLWSDESKFLMFGTDGIKWIRRPIGSRFDHKYQLPTVKHGGGSCIVWGCFSGRGMGPLHHVEGIMDRYKYKEILETKMLPHATRCLGKNYLFQQDNDPKHKSKLVAEWFQEHRVKVMDWPSQSPDLNIIEPMWEELTRQVQGQRARNVKEKFQQLLEAWAAIPDGTINNLIDSMPRRCQAVIDAKGYATKY